MGGGAGGGAGGRWRKKLFFDIDSTSIRHRSDIDPTSTTDDRSERDLDYDAVLAGWSDAYDAHDLVSRSIGCGEIDRYRWR